MLAVLEHKDMATEGGRNGLIQENAPSNTGRREGGGTYFVRMLGEQDSIYPFLNMYVTRVS